MIQHSRDNLLKGDGHVLVVEEITSTTTLHEMFVQMSYLIGDSSGLIEQLDDTLPNLTGLQFVALHYYKDFVSPSNFEGYAIVMMTEVPSHPSEMMVELCERAADEDLGRIFLLAAKTKDDEAALVLLRESDRIIKNRIATLKNL